MLLNISPTKPIKESEAFSELLKYQDHLSTVRKLHIAQCFKMLVTHVNRDRLMIIFDTTIAFCFYQCLNLIKVTLQCFLNLASCQLDHIGLLHGWKYYIYMSWGTCHLPRNQNQNDGWKKYRSAAHRWISSFRANILLLWSEIEKWSPSSVSEGSMKLHSWNMPRGTF